MRLLLSPLLLSASIHLANSVPLSSSPRITITQRDVLPQSEPTIVVNARQASSDTSPSPSPSTPWPSSSNDIRSNSPPSINSKRANATAPTSGGGGISPGHDCPPGDNSRDCGGMKIWVWARDEAATSTTAAPAGDESGTGVTWTGPRPPGCTPEVSLENCKGPGIWVWARDGGSQVEADSRRGEGDDTRERHRVGKDVQDGDGTGDGDGDGGKVCSPATGDCAGCPGGCIYVWASK